MNEHDTDDPIAGFKPSEEWIAEFKKQCSHKMRHDLRTFARWRTRGVLCAGGHVTNAHPDDLIADAIADTLAGVVEWRPEARSLYQHLEDTIQYRTRDERLHAERYAHESIETPRSASETIAANALLEASMLQDRSDRSAEDAVFADEVIARLREMAAGDPEILRLLDAMLGGAQSRTEILEATGMSPRAFRNTRARLHRLADRIDHPRGVRA